MRTRFSTALCSRPGVSGYLDIAVALVADFSTGSDGFELRIVQHVVDDVIERDQLELRLKLAALQSSDGQDALQHGVELHRVLLDAVQHLGAILLIGVARDGQRKTHAGDGRAQFVRDAAQQIAFTLNLVAQLASHDVEVAHQVGDFVLPIAQVFAGTNVEIAARKFMGGIAQTLNGLREVVRDQQTDKRRKIVPSFRVQRRSPGTRSRSGGRREFGDQQVLALRRGSACRQHVSFVRVIEAFVLLRGAGAAKRHCQVQCDR